MTDAGQQTEPIQTEPKNMNVSGTIKIENKTSKKTLLWFSYKPAVKVETGCSLKSPEK